ncbi:hypothetical protein [Paraflavitalea sp. CAU 1676]|uniref:hypothetical protein n=1 Tax=Paraflavitalea sp. CAU 1676 TaxID=3032598 RepID=UPI0023DB13B2|nr:hypothetical protein [Paraflavitalea sp. CAU 1676]MDF2189295.1 hypothetical protein [Paraflavitalea sp. CAU 1676]
MSQGKKMNHLRKKSAIEKYQPLKEQGILREDLSLQLGMDEKSYTPDEIAEILDTLFNPESDKSGEGSKVQNPSKEKPAPKKKEVAKEESEATTGYEEWRMERVNGKLEKLKLVRKNVKISEKEAEALNSAASGPEATNPVMYLKSEE